MTGSGGVPTTAESSSLPLIGREAESAAVGRALKAAAGGQGQILIIEGEAGIGKSRLVQELTDRAAAADFRVLVGYAEDVSSRRSFAAIAEAFGMSRTSTDPELARIGSLLTSGDTPIPAPRRGNDRRPAAPLEPAAADVQSAGSLAYRVREAVVALTERWCADGPVLLVIEDAHWADRPSLDCLSGLSRSCAQLPLLIVITRRIVPGSPVLDSTAQAMMRRGAARLVLAPLSGEDVARLAHAAVGAPAMPALARELAKAGGNPLLLLELLGALREDGSIGRTADGAADITGPVGNAGLPAAGESLGLTILHRLSYLSPDARNLLRAASVIGTSFTVADLCLATGRTAIALATTLAEVQAGGSLIGRGAGLAFRHELIRDALYGDMPAALRGQLHREFAVALADAGAEPDRVAGHLLRSALTADDGTVALLRRTAESLLPRAPSVAVDLIDAALTLVDTAHPLYGALAADRAIALMNAGEVTAGEQACREVLDARLNAAREPELRRLLTRTLIVNGRAAEAWPVVRQAMAMTGVPDRRRAGFHAAASYLQTVLGDFPRAVELAEQAVRLARPTDEPFEIAEAMHAKAQALGIHGDVQQAADLALDAMAELDGAVGPVGAQTLTSTAGLMQMAAGRTDQGRRILLRGRRVNEDIGATSGVALHHISLADGLYLCGEWDDAVAEIEASAGLTGESVAIPATSEPLLAMMAVHRDDLAGARAHRDAAEVAIAAGASSTRQYRKDLAAALLEEAAGQTDTAVTMFRALWQQIARAGNGFAVPEVAPEVLRRLVLAGNTAGTVADIADAAQECADRNPDVPALTGAALTCRGLARRDPDLLVRAVRTYRDGNRPLDRALACEDAAAALAAAGGTDEAVTMLDEALTVFQALGAQRGVARVTAGLRGLGVRRGARGRRQRAAVGWEALTPTERRIVALVAQRLSNPEIAARTFLSRRTVETHVSHALAKTGLASRVEMAAEALRRESDVTGHA